jgi:hypothetical protein
MGIQVMIIIAFLAWLAHQLIDMSLLNKKFIADKLEFRYDKYWRAERFAVVLAWVVMAIFAISYPYVAAEYAPAQSNLFKLFSSVLTGGIGGFAMTLLFGRSKKWLSNKVNEKMNLKNDTNETE